MVTVKVVGQKVLLYSPIIASNSVDYLTAEYVFSDEWNGFEKWATFEKGTTKYQIKLTNDKIVSSDHLNLTEGTWITAVYGLKSGMRITTVPVNLVVRESGTTDGSILPAIPLSTAEQISFTASQAKTIAEGVKAQADAGQFKGDRGERGADGAPGRDGVDGSDYVLTDDDKAEIAGMVEATGYDDTELRTAITTHTSDTTKHITANERSAWNAKLSEVPSTYRTA